MKDKLIIMLDNENSVLMINKHLVNPKTLLDQN